MVLIKQILFAWLLNCTASILPPFSAMHVNLVAQVLSHSFAAGISTLSILGQLDAHAKHTASFVEMFDEMFNAFNSNSLKCSQKVHHAIQNESGKFFLNALTFVDTIQLPSV